MEKKAMSQDRRKFLKTSAFLATGISGFGLLPNAASATDYSPADDLHIIGPKDGFSPHVGTLVSMMNWMRSTVMRSVTGLTQEQLDYLHDPKSNTIGGMLLHLAATEVFYKANTFEGRNDFNEDERKKWGAAMQLGEAGRAQIKGNNLQYYKDILEQTRASTIAELKKRDDKWLMYVDPSFFGRQPTNNYCKWFHVVEHESNHNGQIKWIKSRLPGSTSSDS